MNAAASASSPRAHATYAGRGYEAETMENGEADPLHSDMAGNIREEGGEDGAAEPSEHNDWAAKLNLSERVLHIILFLLQVLYGTFHAITSLAMRHNNNPYTMCCLRESVSIPVLVPLALRLEHFWPRLNLRLAGRLVAIALFGIVGVRLLIYAGIYFASPEITSTLIQSAPLVSMLICVLIGTERFFIRQASGQWKLVSLILTVAGATVMGTYEGGVAIPGIQLIGRSGGEAYKVKRDVPLGIVATLGNVVSFSIFTIMQKSLLTFFPILRLQASMAVLGTAMLFCIVAPFASQSSWRMDAYGWAAILYGGLVSSTFAYCLMAVINRRLDPVYLVAYMPIQPLAASLISALFIGDDIFIGNLVSGGLLVAGVVMLLRGKLLDREEVGVPGYPRGRERGKRREGRRSISLEQLADLRSLPLSRRRGPDVEGVRLFDRHSSGETGETNL